MDQFTDDDAMLKHLKMCITFLRITDQKKSTPLYKATLVTTLGTTTKALPEFKLDEHDLDSALEDIIEQLQFL